MSEQSLRGRWSNGDPVHIVTDGVDRWVAPNRNGAEWIPEQPADAPGAEWCVRCPECFRYPGIVAPPCGKIHDCAECQEQREKLNALAEGGEVG